MKDEIQSRKIENDIYHLPIYNLNFPRSFIHQIKKCELKFCRSIIVLFVQELHIMESSIYIGAIHK